MSQQWKPVVVARALLRHDAVRKASVLLLPERVLLLNGPAGTILRLCDGQRGVGEIARQIQVTYGKADSGARKSPRFAEAISLYEPPGMWRAPQRWAMCRLRQIRSSPA